MTRYFKHKLALRRLYAKKEDIWRKYQRDLKKERAKPLKNDENLQMLASLAGQEDNLVQENIDILETSFIRRQAERRFLEIPEFGNKEMWKECDMNRGHYVLTPKAITKLRSAIVSDRKEAIAMIVQIITAITGLFGVLIGVISACQHK